jgi:hypothetical protein
MRSDAVRLPVAPIYIENYDEGVMRALDGKKDSFVIAGEEAQYYSVVIPGVCGPEPSVYHGKIPIFFGKGRELLHPNVLPSIVVARASIEDDLARVRPKTMAHYVPAFGASRLRIVKPTGEVLRGYDPMETKEASWPVNITYNVQIRARIEMDVLRMFRWVTSHMRSMDLYSHITVWDTANDPRNYELFRESMSDIGDYIDVNDVVRGYEFSYRIEAEIDIEEPTVGRVVRSVETSALPMEG